MQYLHMLLLLVFVLETFARRQAPIVGEDAGRRPSRSSECYFGKQPKEMGSTWFADLGPPFGVMYCIKCECIPSQKKRRVVAHVQCRNIKDECPIPSCPEPVLHPGRCCKTCPGDEPSPDLVQDVPMNQTAEEEEKNMKHFAALLTGRTSMFLHRDDTSLLTHSASQNPQDMVATGRFIFHRKNLHYSFYTSDKRPRPTAIQFVNYEGDILQEQTLGPVSSVYQNSTGKVCGVWRRVPREYRRLLREKKLYVSLLWGSNQSLSGQVSWYHTLNTELFSALLEAESDSMKGTGGTAIVSVHSSLHSIHISLIFNGVFLPDEVSNVPLIVRLESVQYHELVMEELVHVTKPSHELNVVEVRSVVSASHLELMTRGKLILSLKSKSNPETLHLKGRIITRVQCELFQTILSPSVPDNQDDSREIALHTTTASGMAWMFLNHEGSLVYNVQVDELEKQAVSMLTLESGRGRRRVEYEDFTPSLHAGKASGIVDMLSPQELEQLYDGELALNVATLNASSLIRGKLVSKLVAEPRDSPAPVLLKRQNIKKPASLVGLGWLAVDLECILHYEVVLSGLNHEDRSLQLNLEIVPILAEGAPKTVKILERFRGSSLEGYVMGVSQNDLSMIESGVVSLDVRDTITGQSLLKGRVKQVSFPASCRPQVTDNDVPSQHLGSSDGEGPNELTSCYYERRFYDNGMQWTSVHDPCLMCNCHHGQVHCDAVVCPPLTCSNAVRSKPLPGECCPTCSNSTSSQESNTSAIPGCFLANQFHKSGSSWHPYVPPNGFDTCVVCTCDATTLEVHCPRVQCPPLDCNERDAVRPDRKACCKQCPAATTEGTENSGPQILQDQQSAGSTLTQRSAEEILADGGCKNPKGPPFENGQEWHPRLHSYGEYKCVKCRCKDGKHHCERKRCSRSVCLNLRRGLQPPDECCAHCRRNRRHHKQPGNS
ncbi:dorsal-ventral patterning protein Sog [Anabrus simplex]|uniref:dorsal-ventral patterning protein Sog n=1 Tax=Anabrus simplex TaxID=316456 RepID=UPI0034DCD796